MADDTHPAAELALVSTDAIIAELLNRCDHGIVALMRVDEHGLRTHGYRRSWTGNSMTCMGLCHDLASTIQDDFDRKEIVEEKNDADPQNPA